MENIIERHQINAIETFYLQKKAWFNYTNILRLVLSMTKNMELLWNTQYEILLQLMDHFNGMF